MAKRKKPTPVPRELRESSLLWNTIRPGFSGKYSAAEAERHKSAKLAKKLRKRKK